MPQQLPLATDMRCVTRHPSDPSRHHTPVTRYVCAVTDLAWDLCHVSPCVMTLDLDAKLHSVANPCRTLDD